MAVAHDHLSEDHRGAFSGNSLNASLLAISQAIGSSLELPSVLDTILSLSLREMRAQQGFILLFDEHRDRLQMLATIGLPDDIVRKGYVPRKGSIAEWVIDQNRPLILNDRARDKPYRALDDWRRIVSSMCVPLRAGGRVLGTINLNRTDPAEGSFEEEDLAMMEILAGQAAIFIENSRLHESNLKAERLAAIGQTVAGISHCIKNVLTGVRGGMSLIEMAFQATDWKLAGQGKEILHRNLERLSSIVLDMLDYSKQRQPNKSDVSIQSLAEEVFATSRSEAAQRSIELRLRLRPEPKTVPADGQQIYRCVLNLVHNAIDALDEGGEVWISNEVKSTPGALNRLTDPDARRAVILRVGDSGPGISAEDRSVIFEPFFSTKGSKGTGLGLAVTRKIIVEHGGHIELETVAPEPAVFAIYLPG